MDTNNNLTINKNTNLTSLNLYFLYNTEKKKQPIMIEPKKYEVNKINTHGIKKLFNYILNKKSQF